MPADSYRALVDRLPIGIYRSSREGRILDANPALVRMLGYPDREALLATPAQALFVDPADRERWRRAVEREGAVSDAEYRLRRLDGSAIWVRDSARAVTDGRGRALYYEGLLEDVTERKRAEALALGQQRVLELIAGGAPLPDVLDALVRLMEAQAPHMLCSVLALDEEGVRLRHGAAPSLPEEYNRAIDGIAIGPEVGSCGTAAYRGETVVVEDIASDPLWRDYRELALRHGLRACWSTPIRAADGRVLGTFAIYYREPRGPAAGERRLVDVATHVAGIAIERRRAERHLRERERDFRTLVENAPDIVSRFDRELRFVYVNAAIERATGRPPREFIGKTHRELAAPPELLETWETALRAVFETGREERVEFQYAAPRGPAHIETRLVPEFGEDGRVETVLAIARDITRRAQLEEQLRQSQKLEVIGRLAGGVAHDFNNLLTAILGHADLLLDELRPGVPIRGDVEEIRKAAERAASVTRRLLALARRQVMQPRVLDLNAVVAEMERMLRRVIGEDIEFVTALEPELWPVRADPGQMEQVILNLAVNARDAMPDGGTLRIATANLEVGEEGARERDRVPRGRYVLVSVSDTGVGMDDRVRAHLFEPFFTTKEPGKGTGLGLATVYGIVRQSGGHIGVTSEPGCGTTFRIYLPRVDAPVEAAPGGQESVDATRGRETVLVVEDDPAVLSASAARPVGVARPPQD